MVRVISKIYVSKRRDKVSVSFVYSLLTNHIFLWHDRLSFTIHKTSTILKPVNITRHTPCDKKFARLQQFTKTVNLSLVSSFSSACFAHILLYRHYHFKVFFLSDEGQQFFRQFSKQWIYFYFIILKKKHIVKIFGRAFCFLRLESTEQQQVLCLRKIMVS